MHISSSFVIHFDTRFLVKLLWNLLLSEIHWSHVFGRYDFVVLNLACVKGLGVLDIVVLLLNGGEASDLMLGHGRALGTWLLHETNHGFVTFGVEFVVVTWLDGAKCGYSSLSCWHKWVLWQFRLHVISQISKEFDSILKLYIKSLIVDRCPLSLDLLSTAGLSIFAEDSLCLVVIHQVNVINILVSKVKFMFLAY